MGLFVVQMVAAALAVTSSWLRIIQINDVYELDNFSRFKTLIDQHTIAEEEDGDISTPDVTCIICAGDFLAPSLLSSLDQGVAMVDILNMVGCTHVCLGNHENDVPPSAITKRVQQSNFVWINSNIPDLNEKLSVETPTHVVMNVGRKKVAFLGLLTDDPSLYRPGAFGGATILPVMETARDCVQRLRDVDLILPLTHQGIAQDLEFAENFGGDTFPLVLGGHDHEPYDETTDNGSRVIKTGMDAERAAVIDIAWQNEESNDPPSIQVEVLETANFSPDPAVEKRVQSHQAILKELEDAHLFAVADWATSPQVFSTRNNRLGPSTGTTALCSMLRMGMRCDVALLNAGSVRCDQDYPHDTHFTWSDLKAEMPFPTHMTAYRVPGRVLEATIAHSRRFAPKRIAKGGYLHSSRSLQWNDEMQQIEQILGEPFNPDQEYLVAFPIDFLRGIDDHRPLLDWASNESLLINEESAIPAKLVLVEVFSAFLWMRLGTFAQVSRGDDVITKADVKERMMEICGGSEGVADLMLDNVFSVADLDESGTITALEQMIVHFVVADMLDHVVNEEELKVMRDIAARVLGQDPSNDEVEAMVDRIRDTLDLKGTGSVQRDEILEALGDVCSKDLLC